MKSLVLTPMSANQDLPNLIAVLSLPQECNLNWSLWNLLVSMSEVICYIALFHFS